MTVTVNKDILLHPDFSQNLNEILCNYLNALIDEELEKEDADFDFIDECADAINSIRNGFIDAVIPVISRKDFMAKLGIRTVRFSKAFAAVIAAAFMLVAANGIIASATDYNIIEEFSKKIVELFTQEEETPKPTTQPVTTTTAPPVTQEHTTDESTTVVRKAEAITVEFSSHFKKEYNVGESFSSDGIQVFLIYDDGDREKIDRKDYSLNVPSDFGKVAGYETVTVTFKDFESSFKVRILNTKETPLLTSVYATFPSDYEFKSDDLENIDLSRMKVFAVYSDESEKELTSDDYTINFEDISTLFEKKVIVTVTYKTTSCSFTVFKE